MCIQNEVHPCPADGGVWITDNTQHNVFNGGEEDRVHPVAQFWIATCPIFE